MTQGGVGHPDRLTHRAQRRPVHPLLREQGNRALQDLLPAPHPLRIRATPGRASVSFLSHPAIVGASPDYLRRDCDVGDLATRDHAEKAVLRLLARRA